MEQENNFKGIVYKAQNRVTEEVYIGITTDSIRERQLDHIERALRQDEGYFYESISTYGQEVFTWEQIDTANNVNELAAKEKEYIIKFNSKQNGYNSDSGGGVKKKVYQYDLDSKQLINKFECLQDAAKEIEATKQDISRACLSVNKHYRNFYWSYEFREQFKPQKDARRKRVVQYSLDGEFLTEFNSAAEASRQTKVNKGSIAKVCRNERKQAGGFIWEYS